MMKSPSNTIKLWRMILWSYLEWPLIKAGKFAFVTLAPFAGNWIAAFFVTIFGPPREPLPTLYWPNLHQPPSHLVWIWNAFLWSFFGLIMAVTAVAGLIAAAMFIALVYEFSIKAVKWVASQVYKAPSLARELLEKERQALRDKREAAEKRLARREQAERDRAQRSQEWQDRKGRISAVGDTAGPGDIQEAQEGPKELSGDVSGAKPDSAWYFPNGYDWRAPMDNWVGLDGVARRPSEIRRQRRAQWLSSQTTITRQEPDLTDGWNAQIEEYERQIDADARKRELDIEELMNSTKHLPSVDKIIQSILDAGDEQARAEKKLPHEQDRSIERKG
jgi:hypothetical protein